MLKIKNYNSSEVETDQNNNKDPSTSAVVEGYKKSVFKITFKPEHAANPTLIDHVVAETVVISFLIEKFDLMGQKGFYYYKYDLENNLKYFQAFLRDCTIDPTTDYRFKKIVYPKDKYSQEDYQFTRGNSVSLYLQTYYEYTDDSDFDLITEENLHFLQSNPPYTWFENPNAIKCLKAILQAYCWCCK